MRSTPNSSLLQSSTIFSSGRNPRICPKRRDWTRCGKSSCTWYPYDFRFSAKDLISNHLTFQIFHHVTIFPKDKLPKGMVVFGMGLLNGAKMSSSKGNVFLLEDAVSEFGADTVRMFLTGSAEPWQDFDWRNELVLSTKKQIERFYSTVMEIQDAGGEPQDIDRWLIEPLQEHIAKMTAALENFQTRQALQEASFGIETDLKWYRRRSARWLLWQQGTCYPLLSLDPAPCAVYPLYCRTSLEGDGQQGPGLVCRVAGGG